MRVLTIGALLLALATIAPPTSVLAGGASGAGGALGALVEFQPGKCVYAFDVSETVAAGGSANEADGGVKVYYRVIGTAAGAGFTVVGPTTRTISAGQQNVFGANCDDEGSF
jgi:hypothetical protein